MKTERDRIQREADKKKHKAVLAALLFSKEGTIIGIARAAGVSTHFAETSLENKGLRGIQEEKMFFTLILQTQKVRLAHLLLIQMDLQSQLQVV